MRCESLLMRCGALALLAAPAFGQCNKPSPPAELATSIDWVWSNRIRPTVANMRNTILDQIFAEAARGRLNFCVRWDSDEPVSAAKRDQFEPMLHRQMNHWFTWLKGYDCWPYDTIPIKVTGWAVRQRSTLQWPDADSPAPVYVGDIREDAPQCPTTCGRFFHQQRDYQYPSCPGGVSRHYDMSSWHTKGFSGGHGSDWGQRTNSTATLSSATANVLTIILHEIGHGFFLPDFYEPQDMPPGGLPKTIMRAGNSADLTDWDGWMLRRVWSELRGQSGRIPVAVPGKAPSLARPRCSLFREGGRLAITPSAPIRHPLRVEIHDLSGKRLGTADFPQGLQQTTHLGGAELPGGVYLVRIVGAGQAEVRRVRF